MGVREVLVAVMGWVEAAGPAAAAESVALWYADGMEGRKVVPRVGIVYDYRGQCLVRQVR